MAGGVDNPPAGRRLGAVLPTVGNFFVKRDGRWQAVSTQNVTIKP